MQFFNKLILALVSVLFLQMFCNAQEPIRYELTTEQWIKDLEVLDKTIRTKHIDPFYHISQERYSRLVDELKRDIPKLNGREIAVRMIEIAASIGDGHTRATPYSTFRSYPLVYYWFGKELRVIAAPQEYKEWIGNTVVQIQGRPIDEVYNLTKRLIPQHESESFIMSWSQGLIRHPEVLQTLKIINGNDSLELTLKDADGNEKKLKLSGYEFSELQKWKYLRPTDKQSFAAKYPEKTVWFEAIPNSNALYFDLSTYPTKDEMKKVAKSLADEIERNSYKTLLIDLRNNGGGNFTIGQELVNITKASVLKKKLDVYVAINRATYSAAVANATHFKSAFNAKYIGEISGGRPNGYQESMPFILPNSKIPASVSVKNYKFQDENTAGLIPDIELLPEWNSYKNGIDRVLEFITKNGTSK